MSLIEQFGHEAVKAELKDKKWRRDNLHGNAEFAWHIEQHIHLLEAVLLQHRRQHNIFEPDDYIIHGDELKVFAMWSSAVEGCAYIGYAYAENGEMAHKDEFRHATDEEIKAGKRLEVNQ